MHYAGIKLADCANGTGVRTVLFVSGCTHHCKGCFNEDTWDFHYGKPYTNETETYVLDTMSAPYVDGLTVLGGEPMEPDNQRGILPLVKQCKLRYPDKNIWCYTGYLLDEELLKESRARCEVTDELLSYIDVLVDGEFVEEKKNISLSFRGSENQRLIDLPITLATGRIHLINEKFGLR
jgi:anaerobic ribonucleoside-triphosphate reductase activating protein